VKRLVSSVAALALAATSLASWPAQVQAQAQERQVLNVQDADIRAFIQDVSRTTGTTFIIDPRVRGTVSVTSNGPLSRNELFEVFLSTLRANGLVAVPTAGGAYRIAPAEGVAQQPSGPGAVRVATEIFRLRTLEASAAANLVKPLVGPQGQVIPSAQGNALVVADYADNLARVRTLIAQLDQDRSTVQTVTLRFSSAREIATVLNEMMATAGDRGAGRNNIVSVLPVESSNSVVLRGQPEAVQRLLPIIDDLDRRAEVRDAVRVIRLQNADAEQLLPVLQQIVGQTVTTTGASPGLSPSSSSSLGGMSNGTGFSRTAAATAPPPPATTTTAPPSSNQPGAADVRIARYPGANALVISAPPEMQRTLADVIAQLDVRRQQVLVEAIVVEVSDEAAKELGVQFVLGGGNGTVPFTATNFSNNAPNLLALTGAIAGESALSDSTVQALRNTAVQSLVGTTGAITGIGGRINKDALFGLILNAVQRDTASNLLSTPSVLTLDSQEARVLVGQEIPITTGEVLGDANINPFRTVQRKNVGIQLEVRPQINAGGAITLFLRQEVSSIASTVSTTSDDLITNTREIATTVLVDNGDIVVLGGLLRQDEQLTVDKVPGLGDLPAVGGLFRSKSRSAKRTNLMVFIRPTIIGSPSDAQAATASRFAYVRNEGALTNRDGSNDLDELVRRYMGAELPAAPATGPAPPPVSASAPIGSAPLPPPSARQ